MILLETLHNNLRSGIARQAVMNGNFDIWQRGTSFSIVDATLTWSADRWKEYVGDDGGTLPTLTRSRQEALDGLPNSFYYNRLTTNGAGSGFGNGFLHEYYHPIEFGTRYLCGAGRKVTVSFYARSSIANKRLGIWLVQNYGSGGSPSATENIVGEAWTLTSVWTKYEFTFETNTLNGKTFGTDKNDYLQVAFAYAWGTTYDYLVGETTAETYVGSGTIDIAQVQLNAGSVALPFFPKSFAEEYLDCQRYFQKSFPYNTAPAHGASYAGAITKVTDRTGSYQGCYTILPIKMRGTPTVTIYSPLTTTATRIVDLNTPANNYPAYVLGANERYIHIETSASIGAPILIGVHWTADCDL